MSVLLTQPTKDDSIAPLDPRPNRPRGSRAAMLAAKNNGEVFYPESDGKPMADNMAQARWMTFLFINFGLLYADDPNVLVAMDLLWYPIQGSVEIVTAPDVMVIFGRPKYERGSYKQWAEEGVPPQVVFEIMSDSNTVGEMLKKTGFYQQHGVKEFYLYDPDTGAFEVVLFTDEGMNVVSVETEWVSPLLGVRFVPQPRADMEVYYPDGSPFRSFKESADLLAYRTQERDRERERANAERERAEQEARRADAEQERAETERQRALLAEAEVERLRALLAEKQDGI